MSIPASMIRLLTEGGKGVEELITVARAMECGPDAREIFSLYQQLIDAGAAWAECATAILGVAHEINERNARPWHRAAISDVDGNRGRRGISDKKWRSIREQIFERDDYRCQYCGVQDDLTCDHIVPLIRGGDNSQSNLTTACRPCNSSKGTKLIVEWRGAGQ